MKSLPPLNYIRSFEASARHQSFTRAAKELGLTQAAVSGHIRALEQYIGRPLFYRSPRSLTQTEVAASWLPALRLALTQIDRATEQILVVPQRQEVIVACPASLATNWLPRRLQSFHQSHPEIDVTVHATIWSETSDQIADIRIIPRQSDQPVLGRAFGFDRLVMVCAPSLLEGPDRLSAVSDIARFGIIHVLGRQEHWEDFGKHHGQDDLHLTRGYKTDSTNAALQMAAAGIGCAITTHSLAEIYLSRGQLCEPFAAEIVSRWGYDLQTAEQSTTRASETLIAFLVP